MAPELKRDPDLEWLDHVQPVGLVVAPIVLKELGLAPSRQTQADTAIVVEQIEGDSTKPALHEPWPYSRKYSAGILSTLTAALAGAACRTISTSSCPSTTRR